MRSNQLANSTLANSTLSKKSERSSREIKFTRSMQLEIKTTLAAYTVENFLGAVHAGHLTCLAEATTRKFVVLLNQISSLLQLAHDYVESTFHCRITKIIVHKT